MTLRASLEKSRLVVQPSGRRMRDYPSEPFTVHALKEHRIWSPGGSEPDFYTNGRAAACGLLVEMALPIRFIPTDPDACKACLGALSRRGLIDVRELGIDLRDSNVTYTTSSDEK